SGLSVPAHGLHEVLWHPPAGFIAITKAELCSCVSLVSGFSVPARGFCVVLRHTLAETVGKAELVLRVGASLASSLLQSGHVSRPVNWQTLAGVADRFGLDWR